MKSCFKCDMVDEECNSEQVKACLLNSECDYCDSSHYGYPYGIDESRHCLNCGAEWSVYK